MAFSTHTARGQTAITPSDTAPNNFAAIYVGGAGTVVVEALSGEIVTWNVAAGFLIPAQVKKVMTASTATLMIGLNDA